MEAEGSNIRWFTYTGADGEVIPDYVTHVIVKARVVRTNAFRRHRNIVEVVCNENVERIEEAAFFSCRSLRRVIMPGVKVVEDSAFLGCEALEDVESDKLEIIGLGAFDYCESLRSIKLPSARIVTEKAFTDCKALEEVRFGNMLERIEERAFHRCWSLERVAVPLKDGLIADNDIFMECENLHQVDLIEGNLHETIAALQFEEWRNDMNGEIDSINLILPFAEAGFWDYDYDEGDPGEKAQAIRRWIRSVLDKIIHYQGEHRLLLNKAATTLQVALPNEIVMNDILPFLELPSRSFL